MIFFDPFLPQFAAFLFIFSIVLGLLTTAKIFGDHKGVNAGIAVVFGIFSAMYEPFVTGVQTYLPIAAALLVIVFFVVLIKKLFGGKEGKTTYDAVPIAVVLISLLLVLISQWSLLQGFLPAGIDAWNFAYGLGIVMVLIIFVAVYKHKSA
jgi:hypothetical protein